MVPPSRFHEPVVGASSARMRPALLSVPVRLTVPPLRLQVPAGVGRGPRRFRVPRLTVSGPLLDQEPARLRVEPLALRLPLLAQMPLTVRLPPWAWMVPLLAPWLGPLATSPRKTERLPLAVSALMVPWLA